MTRTLAAVLAASVVSAFLFVLLVLPRRPVLLDASGWRDVAARTVAGAYHVHTSRSDGAADKDHVARAAARAGLQFVILTDHGDGSRPPDPPVYLHGVLCVDAVEISTDGGHYVALDMPAAPYPLGGTPSSVVEDVARLGGFGIAAHPDSPKPPLQWRDPAARIDGIEWLSADTEWRNESRRALTRAALGYLVRPGPALATLLDRPATLNRWDAMVRTRPVVALAAHDAHGGIGRTLEDGSRHFVADVPGYEATFRTFAIRASLERPWTGDAAADARALLTALRSGRVFTTIDALASPGLLEFYAETAAGRTEMGGALPAGTPARLVARVLAPPGAQVVLVDDSLPRRRGGLSALAASRRIAEDGTQVLHAQLGAGQGAFRLEVNVPSAPGTPPVPWLVSNPIYFLPPPISPPQGTNSAADEPIDAAAWRVEKDPASSATLNAGPPPVLQYALRGGERDSQFVAVAAPLSSRAFRGVRVRLRADRPMRVSLQVRRSDGQRWRESIYVDTTPREHVIPVTRLTAVEGRADPVEPTAIESLLLVIDLVNALPGAAGKLTIERVGLIS
jgi:hypothetical protein